MANIEIEPKVEVKNIKHVFTDQEMNNIGGDLARSISGLRGVETEFEGVKAQFKSRIAEAEAKIDNLSTQRVNGFEYRNEKCVVCYRPKDRKKDYFLENDWDKNNSKSTVVLTEDMNNDDFALELFQAESKFDRRQELPLFMPTDNDRGVIVIGRLDKLWFTALRVKIGKLELNERLDSEQSSFKKRPDAVERAAKRYRDWLKKNLKDGSEGFESQIQAVVDANKDLEE